MTFLILKEIIKDRLMKHMAFAYLKSEKSKRLNKAEEVL